MTDEMGEPWFVGKDVAVALGYVKSRNALSSHVDSEDKKDALIQGPLGGRQSMTIINESGMYSLILSSKLPSAKQFKRWVTAEVLPQIRKTGGYGEMKQMTDIEMLTREKRIDYDSDKRLKEWAEKLDKTKGELPMEKIVDELFEWTARRMMDAKDNDSKADEMLLKRCAYHGLNFSVPFIVMRHWNELHQDGGFWCGEFQTDDIDWRLAELICNIQYACQKFYFGAMADAYFDNRMKELTSKTQHHQKTSEGFSRLPEEFTLADVMRCFQIDTINSARVKVSRLCKDGIVIKIKDCREKNSGESIYKKTGIIFG